MATPANQNNKNREPIILNLDDMIEETEHVVILNGEKHHVVQPSAENYLKLLYTRRQLLKQNGGEEDEYSQMQQAIKLVSASIPSIPEEALTRMSMAKLVKMIDIVQSSVDFMQVKDGETEGAESGNPGE